jgi:hypothetical protein
MVEEDEHLQDGMFRELIADMRDNIVPVRIVKSRLASGIELISTNAT